MDPDYGPYPCFLSLIMDPDYGLYPCSLSLIMDPGYGRYPCFFSLIMVPDYGLYPCSLSLIMDPDYGLYPCSLSLIMDPDHGRYPCFLSLIMDPDYGLYPCSLSLIMDPGYGRYPCFFSLIMVPDYGPYPSTHYARRNYVLLLEAMHSIYHNSISGKVSDSLSSDILPSRATQYSPSTLVALYTLHDNSSDSPQSSTMDKSTHYLHPATWELGFCNVQQPSWLCQTQSERRLIAQGQEHLRLGNATPRFAIAQERLRICAARFDELRKEIETDWPMADGKKRLRHLSKEQRKELCNRFESLMTVFEVAAFIFHHYRLKSSDRSSTKESFRTTSLLPEMNEVLTILYWDNSRLSMKIIKLFIQEYVTRVKKILQLSVELHRDWKEMIGILIFWRFLIAQDQKDPQEFDWAHIAFLEFTKSEDCNPEHERIYYFKARLCPEIAPSNLVMQFFYLSKATFASEPWESRERYNIAVHKAIKNIHKTRKQELHKLCDGSDSSSDSSIMVGDAIELPFSSLERLRPDQWLDLWLIAAAMELTDRPSCVKYGLSIPLDQHNGNHTVPVTKPFGLWRRKLDAYRHECRDGGRDDSRLILLCPLNLNTNHFTLLEINDHARTIYHYDSMAGCAIKQRNTRVRRLVEAEFKDLGFEYNEAPCPQQEDGHSCGLMVIRNAVLRMNGRQVGGWDMKVNPERVRMNVISLLRTGLYDKFSCSQNPLGVDPNASWRIWVWRCCPDILKFLKDEQQYIIQKYKYYIPVAKTMLLRLLYKFWKPATLFFRFATGGDVNLFPNEGPWGTSRITSPFCLVYFNDCTTMGKKLWQGCYGTCPPILAIMSLLSSEFSMTTSQHECCCQNPLFCVITTSILRRTKNIRIISYTISEKKVRSVKVNTKDPRRASTEYHGYNSQQAMRSEEQELKRRKADQNARFANCFEVYRSEKKPKKKVRFAMEPYNSDDISKATHDPRLDEQPHTFVMDVLRGTAPIDDKNIIWLLLDYQAQLPKLSNEGSSTEPALLADKNRIVGQPSAMKIQVESQENMPRNLAGGSNSGDRGSTVLASSITAKVLTLP
ncbi:hypothetical protein M406DRAFT_71396 [Cryphonectria parasitica EP155]|uniref:Ubiquitin-like protease family profile domain-containing protein n=1 Tax=Cryphonectria parasitica (strain ATCC 38755 / EP155) TaxID=660469 RepID=A0A9P4Y7V0_CRYP1|nr:uncharacterized protein M406DRAFT_71396 [Cryphonectria parasitica EP155]KAF3768343.1 hypothetical protein M406DRAFT_71396 [Cryphonectria parasitica EP155]